MASNVVPALDIPARVAVFNAAIKAMIEDEIAKLTHDTGMSPCGLDINFVETTRFSSGPEFTITNVRARFEL